MMISVKKQELARIRRQNARMRNENLVLRCSLKDLERNPYSECRDVLKSICQFCTENYRSEFARDGLTGPPYDCPGGCPPCPPDDQQNQHNPQMGNMSQNATTEDCEGKSPHVGRGCGEGMCGGYTPSGWNKLKTIGAMDGGQELGDDRGAGPSRGRPDAGGAVQADIRTRSATEGCGCPGAGSGKFRPSARLLGEMAFQLERRILDYVFGLEGAKKRRFYGYTVSNICYMMEKKSTTPDGASDQVGRTEMTCRLRKILCALEKYGYDIKIHADFSQEIINKYGLLPSPPDAKTIQTFGLNDACTIACLISRLSSCQSEVHNLNILLNSLNFLSKCDQRPLFVWQ